MFWFLLALGILGAGAAVAARVGENLIAGRVVDAATGEPLVNANVYVLGGTAGTVSVAGGYFALPDAPREPFTLVVTYLGYEPVLIRVDPAAFTPATELPVALQPTVYEGEEVVITASRYGSDVHLSQTNIPGDEIRQRQSEVDIPLLLEDTPGLYATSDAGNGVGYTYLKIRGFDQKRVGVLVNGIPLNDPEDQQVYWVDLPDLASSLEDVQIQRGVTNSLGGLNTIGGTVNLVTDVLPVEPAGHLSLHAGSYGTAKQTLSYKTGLLGGRFSTALRVSHLESDGYRQRSGSDQWAVFWSGRFVTPRSSTQVNIFTGRELTHHAWDPAPEEILARDRTFNPERYPNAVDDFRQPHYELHHVWQLGDRLILRNSFFGIHGEGFYENFKDGRRAEDFSLDRYFGFAPDERLDLVRRKYVRKDQLGWVPRLELEHAGGRLIAGGDAYTFHSDHWGDVLMVEGVPLDYMGDGLKYYHLTGDKKAWSAFLNERYAVPGWPAGELTLLADLQFQHRDFELRQQQVGNFQGEFLNALAVDYDFFNPKGGFFWRLPGQTAGGEIGLYGHVGVAHREPSDAELYDTWEGPDDLGVTPLFRTRREVLAPDGVSIDHVEWSDPYTEAEKVLNYEFGAAFRGEQVSLTLNGYWMDFDNEIVPYGAVDDDGNPIKGNIDRTFHRGVELGLTVQPQEHHLVKVAGSRSWDEFDRAFLPDGSEAFYSGNPIALFPEYLGTVSWRADWGPAATRVRLRLVGKQYLDNTGRQERTIPAYETVDLALAVKLDRVGLAGLSGAKAELQLRNMLDEKYETNGYWGWDGQRYLIPAAGRNFLAGVQYDF